MPTEVTVEAIAYELPPHRISSSWLEEQFADTLARLGMPLGNLAQLTGIQERRFWDPGIQPSDVATIAGRKVIEMSGIDPMEIGCVINTSVCKDYLEPSVASLVHGNLQLSPHCLNFDIGNACLGFLNGMETIRLMLEAGQIKYGLLVDGEGSRYAIEQTIKRLQAPTCDLKTFRDHFATLTLGSGAVAMLLTHQRNSKSGHVINGTVSLAATQHSRLCLGQPDMMITDASALLAAGVELAQRTWRLAGERLKNWRDAAINLYAPHQVSMRHITALCDTLGLTLAKQHLNLHTLGNIGPAALPITLAMADEAGRLKSGDHVGLLAIGSGLNCSMMSVTW